MNKKWIVERVTASANAQAVTVDAETLRIDAGCLVFGRRQSSGRDRAEEVILSAWAPGTWFSCRLDEQLSSNALQDALLAYIKSGRNFQTLDIIAAEIKHSPASIDWELVRMLNDDRVSNSWLTLPVYQARLSEVMPELLRRHPRANFKSLKEIMLNMPNLKDVPFCQIALWQKLHKN